MAVTDILKRDPVAAARKTHEAALRGLSNALAKQTAAVAEVEAAERAQTVAATADGDAADGVLENATRRLRDARDLVEAFDRRVIPAAEAAVMQAEAAVADAEKQVQYAAAEAQGKAARAKLAKEYPDIQRRYTELLEMVVGADAAIEAANANPPAEASPLPTVEAPIRDFPAQPERILSDTVQPLWYHQDGSRVRDQSRVKDGKYQHHKPGIMVHNVVTDHCRKIDTRVVVSVPFRAGVSGPRLSATKLPPLKAEAPADLPEKIEYRVPDAGQREGLV
ncbi:hypothetical protein [Brevundimonas sp. SGAir0440]|uniref:hypothetical protein n=1 Tax=Brevundimonas sp. SGAir0440 TaxID=2579977 RepID=UPI0010CD63E6|nr:hypothetical protein [Brevundimonas sp. SGAir0440]QCQ97741.1 hypothetical protein E7T10_03185 [Brevundimonas sp. SGAir0440]